MKTLFKINKNLNFGRLVFYKNNYDKQLNPPHIQFKSNDELIDIINELNRKEKLNITYFEPKKTIPEQLQILMKKLFENNEDKFLVKMYNLVFPLKHISSISSENIDQISKKMSEELIRLSQHDATNYKRLVTRKISLLTHPDRLLNSTEDTKSTIVEIYKIVMELIPTDGGRSSMRRKKYSGSRWKRSSTRSGGSRKRRSSTRSGGSRKRRSSTRSSGSRKRRSFTKRG